MIRIASVALCVLAAAAVTVAPLRAPGSSWTYLFSYFTGNGEDGLHLARSENGLTWTPVGGGRSYLRPTVGSRLLRDPCLLRGSDGTFHLVWTTGWWDKGIGIAHLKDLQVWTTQRFVPVMEHEPEAQNAWAPELVYDRKKERFLLYWASTIRGRFPETEPGGDSDDTRRLNHRLYATTTTDFVHFAPTRLFYDGGFNVIDGTIIDMGSRAAMIVKDETRWPSPKKHLRMTFAAQLDGPWDPAGPAFSEDWVEGPTAVRLGRWWIVYFDEYTRKRYGALRTTDFARWENISDQLSFPSGARHGTVLRAPRRIVDALK